MRPACVCCHCITMDMAVVLASCGASWRFATVPGVTHAMVHCQRLSWTSCNLPEFLILCGLRLASYDVTKAWQFIMLVGAQ